MGHHVGMHVSRGSLSEIIEAPNGLMTQCRESLSAIDKVVEKLPLALEVMLACEVQRVSQTQGRTCLWGN